MKPTTVTRQQTKYGDFRRNYLCDLQPWIDVITEVSFAPAATKRLYTALCVV
jgi:hypothetical protein